VALPEDGDNKVVFAIKGDRLWMKDDLSDELLNRLRLRHAQNDFPKLGFRSRHCKWASHPNPQSPAIDALEDLCEATEKR
jgi:hypothetical protein